MQAGSHVVTYMAERIDPIYPAPMVVLRLMIPATGDGMLSGSARILY